MTESFTFPYVYGEENYELQVSILDSNAMCKHRHKSKEVFTSIRPLRWHYSKLSYT